MTDFNILNPEHEDFDEARRLDQFKISGTEYIRANSLASGKESRTKRSPVWRYGEKLIRLKDKREVYYCYQCERQKRKQPLPKLSGNTGAHQHLLHHHNIDGDGQPKQTSPAGQRAIDDNAFTLVTVARKSEFQRLLVRWLVYCHICLSMVENEYFRELISYLNKGLADLIPLAKATIRRWIISAYEEEREKVKEEMKTAISNIHISFDMWTSPNYLAMISIFAHYLDKEGIRRNRLIAFKRVLGAHTGENQAALIVETLLEYNITSKTRYFMSDNANSNDACVDQVLKTISPELSPAQRKARRLRCLGHVVNLCARALLIGKESKKTLRKLESASGGESESMWRDHGPVGKLHNIIKYIRWTPQRREQFAGIRIKGGLAKFDELEVGRDHVSLVHILICLRYVMSSARKSLLTNNSSSKTMTRAGTVSSLLLDVLSMSENGLLSSATCIKL